MRVFAWHARKQFGDDGEHEGLRKDLKRKSVSGLRKKKKRCHR